MATKISKRVNRIRKHIVVMGGGTGSFAMLSGLRDSGHYISAIVTMSDNGGSSGLLRDELGVLPPGDVRQCLVALSRAQKALRELFTHRFSQGSLKGHTVGNLFLAGLEDMTGSFEKAVKTAADVLQIQGQVIPATLSPVNLVAFLENGKRIFGETNIDIPKHDGELRIKKLLLEPKAAANPAALKSIAQADYIIIGPGDLYTSIIPNLLVGGIPEAINASKAKKIYVCSIMTKFGETNNFSASDFFRAIQYYITKIDYFVLNKEKPLQKFLSIYKKEHAEPVRIDQQKVKALPTRAIYGKFLSSHLLARASGHANSSLIRHDSKKIAQALLNIIGV